MSFARLEHINITVPDPKKTAQRFVDLFGWHIRWEGGAIHSGYSIHVGNEDTYLALYSGSGELSEPTNSYETKSGLNHIGLVVDDLDDAEQKILAAGFKTHSHQDYEPGRRFYFDDADNIEIEVVCYA